jgi:methionyl-tRNA synthetase
MLSQRRSLIVTSALPYANGPIHLGHLVEYIQSDIWCRYQKMQRHQCTHVCADDAHGTAIMLRAKREKMDPSVFLEQVIREHKADFAGFHIDFDYYYSTDTPENHTLCDMIYERNRAGGHITRRVISQAYDPEAEQFLPDRFIQGTCPKCGATEQYGDHCEACGAIYSPTDLIDPTSAISGATPVTRESEHLFFKLADFTESLQQWCQAGHVQPEVANKLQEWFDAGLADWDISRDEPYYGFPIPGEKDKYFYVWVDAPVGYIASFNKYCAGQGLDYEPHWQPESATELYHFIGKDIITFHTLFWPALLEGAGLRRPTGVFAHGFLTVNGRKMSKSRGTFIRASTYLRHLNPEYLRYYFATRLSSGLDDIDLNFADFAQRINSDLVGKVVNIASRCAGFIHKQCHSELSAVCAEPELYQEFAAARHEICDHYEQREYAKAMRCIMALADRANQYINEEKPWVLAKQEGHSMAVQQVCSVGLNLFRLLIFYLKPVLPIMTQQAETFLNTQFHDWSDCDTPLLRHTINPFVPLLTRVNPADIEAMLADTEETGRLV